MNKNFYVDKLNVIKIDDRTEMGIAAAKETAELIRKILLKKEDVNIIFASSPYLLDVYKAMIDEKIEWNRVNAFHMDEYVGVSIEHKASFANFLRNNLLGKVPVKNAFYMDGLNDPEDECKRYTKLLDQYPVDITMLGIGTNGHLAFNDPYLADFFDDEAVKINPDMDDECRRQQIVDGWFAAVEEMPKASITITIPAMLKAPYTITVVPGVAKKEIIKKTLEGPIGLDVPATSLRLHRNAKLYIDAASSADLVI